MTIAYWTFPRIMETPLTPMARLIVIVTSDWLSEAGPHYGLATRIAKWTVQPDATVATALNELETRELVFTDPCDVDGSGSHAMWLCYAEGWELAWEDLIWLRHPPTRQPVPKWLRALVMERDGNRCQECGRTVDLTIDHKHPVSRGGMTVEANLQVLCRPHNSRKSDRVLAVA